MPESILSVVMSRTFGPHSRFRLDVVTSSRFPGEVFFHVFDAEVEDEVTGKPALIRQASSEAEALMGLADSMGGILSRSVVKRWFRQGETLA